MSLWIRAIALLVSFAVSVPALAQRLPQIRVPADQFHPSWNSRLPTSGGELLGLMGGDAAAWISEPTVVIGGISDQDKTICVAIRQVSGAYSADFAIRNSRVGNKVAFLLPPRLIKTSGVAAAELAVLARASPTSSCKRDGDILPAGWNSLPSRGLIALVNTHQADRARTMAPQRGADCEKLTAILPGRALTTYQAACHFATAAPGCSPVPLVIQLDNAGEVTSLRATLRRSCP